MTVVKIFNDNTSEQDTNTTWSMDDVKEYVKQYRVYKQQIKDLQQSLSEWSSEFIKDKSLPKKELATALRADDQELDMDVVNNIYDTITGSSED
jgi:hypothetical protein